MGRNREGKAANQCCEDDDDATAQTDPFIEKAARPHSPLSSVTRAFRRVIEMCVPSFHNTLANRAGRGRPTRVYCAIVFMDLLYTVYYLPHIVYVF